ncbi:glucose-6-phosphate isomerase [bacterium]|nr:glucose-6-phosphate isomerase [bacterium]
MSLTFDYTSTFEDIVGKGNGIKHSMLDKLNDIFQSTRADLLERNAKGDLPFWDLPFNNELISDIEEYASNKKNRFKNFVLFGIGGSALGPTALHGALNHLQHNLLPNDKRSGCCYFCPDNVDPDLISSVFDVIDPNETLFNVITKSGGTSETVGQFLVILDLLKHSIGENWRDHLVVTTDPHKGFMREFCTIEGVKSFDIDPGVGGRFTVLTPVGLLPAKMTGIDIRSLCKGAGEMKEYCFRETFVNNPAAMLAAIFYLAQTKLYRPIHVVFAYSNRLYPIGDWFRQLWAESLGKRYSINGKEVFTGPTPVKAIGATDQHSQVQLYIEGPADKIFLILGSKTFKSEITIPDLELKHDTVAYLQDTELSTLLNYERFATAYALTKAGRPNMTIEMDEINPVNIGALLYLLEAATLYAGGFYNVNPLDQPGVEAGKQATYALMGKPGYGKLRQEMNDFKGIGRNLIEIP